MATYKEQANSIYTSLSDFFKSEAAAASDTTGNVLPEEFRDYLGGLDYSELLRICTMFKGDSPSFGNGKIIETVSHAAAVMREHILCSKTKVGYISDRASVSTKESQFFINENTLTKNRING